MRDIEDFFTYILIYVGLVVVFGFVVSLFGGFSDDDTTPHTSDSSVVDVSAFNTDELRAQIDTEALERTACEKHREKDVRVGLTAIPDEYGARRNDVAAGYIHDGGVWKPIRANGDYIEHTFLSTSIQQLSEPPATTHAVTCK